MNQTLMRLVLESAAFLELSGDDIVKPDSATAQLEEMAAQLQTLSEAERRELTEFAELLAREEKREHGRTPRSEFFLSIAEGFGLR